MIIAEIIGGLGNQMFQYAAARALALQRGQRLMLDLSKFDGYMLHQGFELGRLFECPVQIAEAVDMRKVLGWQGLPRIRDIFLRSEFEIFRKKEYIVEPHFQYWSGLEMSPDDCYMTGYWQSEKYFQKIASTIRSDFTFSTPLSPKNTKIANEIRYTNSVSLHVRRGDYMNNVKTKATHGVCSIEYYKEAVNYIFTHVDSPHFFIFSDDIDWTKKNLTIDAPCSFIEHNKGKDSFNDMRLMSLCHHNIIANSSFSWWGAWLNTEHEKIVIAPERWFAVKKNTSDLIPEDWVSL